jgi:phage recombination protein Bet
MSTAMEIHQTAALAIRPGQEMWTDKQRAALAVLGITGATNGDLAVFMHYCQKTGLDPFSRQIYMINRQGKQTIQVGIDGFRVIRDRLAARAGVTVEYEDTIWYDADGREHKVWLWDEPPVACRVTVLKDGKRFPGVVKFGAYAATKDGKLVAQWRTQPDHMIEKCAEAFALRRAFPHDLGGIYLEDEMAPAAPVAGPLRVTAAEIIRQPEPAPPPPAEATSNGEAKHEPRQPQPAGKQAIGKLAGLLRALELGTDEDVAALVEWQCGEPYAGTRSQVQLVTSFLEDHLAACQGDTAEAASAIWAQYRAVTGQDAAGEPEAT